jgi:hypothetical protein
MEQILERLRAFGEFEVWFGKGHSGLQADSSPCFFC